ncbi:o-succinylbenzoate synthase [Rhodococcoides corynebacterioides]|uniref:o-succinylbenzoate synthase n=1 Tax=Rhodococcoides corynebacterioides TaxID=53972 RepID=A0ABS7P6Y6_9NOCA|nr:o-succinylbenzoate synthase [Rhodococcus corynebacterioides]MBY6367796.1 o-succinylbenzoate synthase [Rhodococcus corynebacterioides]MBY6408277.1 o-succinylbenzoate synthase [Rhodococcus corynebacterioides]
MGPADLLASAHVVALPMRTRFRGITVREAMVFEGPAGWGEFAAFPEYDDAEAALWLAAGLEAATLGPPDPVREWVDVNATVPAVPATDVPDVLARFPGARTAKVKVAEKGQSLADDVARVEAVRALVPTVRVDANGGWTVDEAERALHALTATGDLEYAEQPCASVEDLAEVRRRVPGVAVAADESIRRADDPLRVVRAGAADVAVVKVPPLGGMRAVVALADQLAEYGVPVVVSSALDTAVGMSAGLAAAAALQSTAACGLATGALFTADLAPPRELVDGRLCADTVVPDSAALTALAAPEDRRRWWIARAERCLRLL